VSQVGHNLCKSKNSKKCSFYLQYSNGLEKILNAFFVKILELSLSEYLPGFKMSILEGRTCLQLLILIYARLNSHNFSKVHNPITACLHTRGGWSYIFRFRSCSKFLNQNPGPKFFNLRIRLLFKLRQPSMKAKVSDVYTWAIDIYKDHADSCCCRK